MDKQKFEAIAEIDYHYWQLRKIAESYKPPKNGIEEAIDTATGYTDELLKSSIDCLSRIVELKKTINADYSEDEKNLNGLKELQ